MSIGPEEIIESIDTYAGPNSGRATVIAVNPMNSNDVWLGTATGGVWHSTNITAPNYEWSPVTDAAPSLSIGSILLEDCTVERCNTVWVGTGEKSIRRDTYYGQGLLKLSWNTDHYKMEIVENTVRRFSYGSIIDIKRFGSSLYIAVSKGKSASSSTAIVTAPEPQDGYGIHRSDDNGLTWQKVGTSPNGALPSDMEIQNGTLLVGFYNTGICRLLPGDIWSPIGPAVSTSKFDHVEIAVAPTNYNTIYAAYGQCESETYLCDNNPLFYVSTDGGASWRSRVNPSGIHTYSRYTHLLTVNPVDEGRVYYGGLHLWFSSDYANNFAEVTDANLIHWDIQDLVIPDPNEPLKQYIASDGGFYLRDRRPGINSTVSRNHGLSTVQQYSVSSSNSDRYQQALGGVQDNGTVYFTGSPIWEFVLEGDGGDCLLESEGTFYAQLQDGDLKKAVSMNLNISDFRDFMEGIDPSDQSLFFSPLRIHPTTHTLYCGRTRLYRRGQTDAQWVPASPTFDISTNKISEIERRNAISAIALSRSNPHVVYVALYNGDVWVSSAHGPCTDASCWSQIGGGGTTSALPVSVPTSLDVDPLDDRTAYITYSDFADRPKVWRTQNRGASWEPFSEELPSNLPIKVIRVKPDENTVLYLGTDRGIYIRDLLRHPPFGNSNWCPYGYDHGMPSVPVYAIDFDTPNRLVYAATHGRGTYMLSEKPVVYPIIRFGSSGERQLYLFGYGFHKNNTSKCSIAYLDKSGKVKARTFSDARGGVLDVNEMGRLVSINTSTFGTTTMVVPCMEGDCLEDSELGIPLAKSEIAQIEITYGEQRVIANIKPHATIQENPPSTFFKVRKLTDKSVGRVYMSAIAVSGTQKRFREEITATVHIGPEDADSAISQHLVKSFNSASLNSSAGYLAAVQIPKGSDRKKEDAFVPKPFISLKNKELEAMQIFTAYKAYPGEANGFAFDIESIGLRMWNEMIPVKVTFVTTVEGAQGGSLTFAQRTPAGVCKFKLKTFRGQSSEQIATDLHNALVKMPYPGTMDCESRHNSFDLQLQKSSIITSSAIGLSIEIEDPGIGVTVSPD